MVRVAYHRGPISHYLTYLRKWLTAATTNYASAHIAGDQTATFLSDVIKIPWLRELILNFNIGAPGGTSPTLSIALLIYDMMEGNTILTLTLTATDLAAAATVRFVATPTGSTVWINGTATALGLSGVPRFFQVQFTIGGTSPTWPIAAVYEADG